MYWFAVEGEPESPLAPLIAHAQEEGYPGERVSGTGTGLFQCTDSDRRYRAAVEFCENSLLPDGARIITASLDCTARIWDATTGQEILALRGHELWVWSASFSPDGARIVTASGDYMARLWDATTDQEILALRGHELWVWRACLSPDGARIVTASSDDTARLWDATTGQEITRIVLDASVTGFSVHGGANALGDALGRIHVFESGEFLTAKGSARS